MVQTANIDVDSDEYADLASGRTTNSELHEPAARYCHFLADCYHKHE
jgi:hypothetical protein